MLDPRRSINRYFPLGREKTHNKGDPLMNIAIWIVQVILAIAFAMAGMTKAFGDLGSLAASMPWIGDVPAALTRFIGVAEMIGALGLILPALTRVRPILTPLAAMGLATIMLLAAIFHATRGEFGDIARNLVLLAVALIVAYGRCKRVPIEPRSKSLE